MERSPAYGVKLCLDNRCMPGCVKPRFLSNNCDSSIYFSRQRKSIQKILEIKNQNLGEFGLMSFSKLNLKNIRNSKYCIGIEEIFSNELKNCNF